MEHRDELSAPAMLDEVHGEAPVLPGRGNDVKELCKDDRSMLDKIWWFGVAHRRRDLR